MHQTPDGAWGCDGRRTDMELLLCSAEIGQDREELAIVLMASAARRLHEKIVKTWLFSGPSTQ